MINQIVNGVYYLHTLDPPVIHGDIKGANILISEDEQCHIADFGLARLDSTPFNLISPESDSIQGSIRWLSPELLNPDSAITENRTARDIYAFACTVIEVLTDLPPYPHRKQDIQVMFDVLSGIRPQRPNDLCPDWLWKALQLCWHEKIILRPSASSLLTIFNQSSSQPPISIFNQPPTQPPRLVFGQAPPTSTFSQPLSQSHTSIFGQSTSQPSTSAFAASASVGKGASFFGSNQASLTMKANTFGAFAAPLQKPSGSLTFGLPSSASRDSVTRPTTKELIHGYTEQMKRDAVYSKPSPKAMRDMWTNQELLRAWEGFCMRRVD
ncbi:kinase-like protein [Moniliophthora roreri MCA 2997]|nr:kinase-like protein [Moniliophthora roreri MCA 2997]